jgi:hypothetical protein
MGYFENWLVAIATLVAVVIFVYSTFDLLRRLLSRLALRVCQLLEAPEGGIIDRVERRLQGYAKASLVSPTLMSMASFGFLVFILIEHSEKL